MKKSNSLLSKAINEAETIRAGAMKNAHEILFNTFQPKIKSLFNEVLKEQVGVVNQDPMDGPEPAKYDQDKADSDLQNPENAMHAEGDGPELLEDEGFENPDGDDELPEQDDEELVVTDLPEQGDDELNFDELPEQDDEFADAPADELPEQGDEFEAPADELPEQGDEEVDDFMLPEQDDEFTDAPEDMPEQDDEFATDEVEEGCDLTEQEDDEFALPEGEEIDVVDDETIPEQTNVNPSMDQDVKKLANENRNLKVKVNNLVKRNKELAEGVENLRKKISEVSLFNAKVGAANKITSYKGLSEGQKIKMLEAFDKCRNIREVKLTYTNFKNFVRSLEDRKRVTESRKVNKIQRTLSSKNVATAKRSAIMSEEQRKTLKLAGILS